MLNSNRKQRPSFLRPLTPISPLGTSRAENISSGQKENVLMGPTSRGSLPSSVYGVRPRSKSVTGNQTHATSFSAPSAKITRNGASSLGATPSGSARSSRHSSFAAESTRRPSSVRDPTSSRRGSLWSEFGDDAVSGGRELTEEEKALEAQKSFASSAKTLWESGVDRLVVEAWSSFGQGWKSGDIVGLISVDRFNLPRVERARIIVLIDDLELQLQDLATTSLSLPGAIAFLRDPSWVNSAGLIDALLASPNHVYSLLKVLDSAARLWLRAAPSIVDQFSTPRNIEDTLDHSLNLCAFLTGSSTDLRRAFVASLSLLKEFSALLDRASRAAISINSNAPHDVAAFTPSFHASSSSVYLPHYVLGQLDEFTAYIKSLLSQPKTSNSIEVFQAELGSLWSALIGNARVARVARGLERIWENKSTTLREKAVAMLAAADGALKWEIDSVTSETDDFKFTFGSLKPHLSELVPREVAFTYAPIGINARHQSPSSVVLRGLRLAISDATYEITKHGLLGFADSGIASIVVPFELEICFTGDNQNRPKIKLNFYEKQEVTLHSGGNPIQVH
ncbi:uncharacterized protein EI90DRAFT_924607 [Cantharellus anzutake]|uniref:uncharacterized protein n=1 Tax=Cantharellus anzutake TaxID=1750568 RepID=UPI0019076F1C|nr:uncharacterized protein EI90DRAFT_924607 [Cantharellus anzutake]KAF8332095.1 hypothetical protein EI90DRAFT_924607 [Cantharellus anzutake]